MRGVGGVAHRGVILIHLSLLKMLPNSGPSSGGGRRVVLAANSFGRLVCQAL